MSEPITFSTALLVMGWVCADNSIAAQVNTPRSDRFIIVEQKCADGADAKQLRMDILSTEGDERFIIRLSIDGKLRAEIPMADYLSAAEFTALRRAFIPETK